MIFEGEKYNIKYMSEITSLITLKDRFKSIVGFRAPVEISSPFALDAARRVVELDEKILTRQTTLSDMYISMISASMLLQWWEQINREVVSGQRSGIKDEATLLQISSQFSSGDLPKEEIKRLTALKYVADPQLGSNKAMNIFESLRKQFPEAPLIDKQQS